jgi:glutamate/tyrosine decarboxylase-like PLP-dependent enzyme
MWFHVDAAFGAWAAITPNFMHLVKGMDRADSLAVDLHKWMYMPYGIGVTLVRDSEAHYNSFREEAAYITHGRSLSDLTLELSKPFRSLKAWMRAHIGFVIGLVNRLMN